jgi:hypothetical protein
VAPITINKVRVIDLRFPTSRERIGSDAVKLEALYEGRHLSSAKPRIDDLNDLGQISCDRSRGLSSLETRRILSKRKD